MIDLDSLFNLSYGMCIVSSKNQDKINGCIVNTVFQITPKPPMVAISLNREDLTWDYIKESGVFAISILAEEAPTLLIGKFGFRSGRDFNKFEGVAYKLGETGCPLVTDSVVGFIEVKVTDSVDVGTHTIFIGEIVACQRLCDDKYPMTYNYYRDVKHGKTPKSAATYHETPKQDGLKEQK